MNTSDANRYEGLNLPDLMALMHPVVYPEEINLFPATTGWLMIGLWIVCVIVIIVTAKIRRYRAARYRREAAQLIHSIPGEDHQDTQAIASLVKRTAIAAYPRSEVASLTGSDWKHFLQQTSLAMSDEQARVVSIAAYDPTVPTSQVRAAALLWIRTHHA